MTMPSQPVAADGGRQLTQWETAVAGQQPAETALLDQRQRLVRRRVGPLHRGDVSGSETGELIRRRAAASEVQRIEHQTAPVPADGRGERGWACSRVVTVLYGVNSSASVQPCVGEDHRARSRSAGTSSSSGTGVGTAAMHVGAPTGCRQRAESVGGGRAGLRRSREAARARRSTAGRRRRPPSPHPRSPRCVPTVAWSTPMASNPAAAVSPEHVVEGRRGRRASGRSASCETRAGATLYLPLHDALGDPGRCQLGGSGRAGTGSGRPSGGGRASAWPSAITRVISTCSSTSRSWM